VNLVTGSGAEIGDAIVDDPDVGVISFTGSSATGRAIAERAGRRLKRLSLELGGKNAVVVLRDADLDLAVDGILWSAFGTTGQRCTACSRVVADRPIADELVRRLAERAERLSLGSGLDETVDVGPLVNAPAVDKVASYVAIGRGEGELVTGGERETGDACAHGHFYQPTIFTGVGPMSRIAQEEIFGPVLSLIPYDDLDDAIAIANDSDYGLAGAVYTADIAKGIDVARKVRTGTFAVNTTQGMDFNGPFGGFKNSGIGRELGPEGIHAFCEDKTISLPGGIDLPIGG
jgi:aldehyde dehydrogenase (NAD+)